MKLKVEDVLKLEGEDVMELKSVGGLIYAGLPGRCRCCSNVFAQSQKNLMCLSILRHDLLSYRQSTVA